MPPENSEQNFSADDLASLGETPADDGAGGDGAKGAPPADGKQPAAKQDASAKDAAAKDDPAAKDGDKKTIVTGADAEAEDKAKDDAKAAAKQEQIDRNELTEDLRKMIAEHYAAGDKRAEAKELRRLERVKDIKSLWGLYRELEGKFTGGGLIKKPGKDAKPEEIAEYHKALGVPEKPEDYFKDIKLANGAVIGEADRAIADGFAAAVHKSGATPAMVSAALDWYYAEQETKAAELDEADDAFRRESERALKDELGPAYRRTTAAIGTLFATAPGGVDVKNENSLYARLMAGRTADNKVIGNDPDIVRWLASLAHEVNPAATVVEDGNQTGLTIDQELKQIADLRKSDRKKYYSEPVQRREAELISAREKIRAKA